MDANELFNKTIEFIEKYLPSEKYFNNRNFSKRIYWEKRDPQLVDYVFNLYDEHNSFFKLPFSNFIKFYFLNRDIECYRNIEDFLTNSKHTQINKGTFKHNNYYNLAKEFINFEPKNFTEIFYCYRNDIIDRPLCSNECGASVEFHTTSIGYRKFCSQRCQIQHNNSHKEIKESNLSNDEIINLINSVPIDHRNLTNEIIASNFINIKKYSKHIPNIPPSERIYLFMNGVGFNKCPSCDRSKTFISQGQGYKKTCGRISCINISKHGDSYYNEDEVNTRVGKGGRSYNSGFLYVMGHDDIFKIGITQNPTCRLRDMKKIIPELEYIICSYYSSNLTLIENKLHQKFKDKNILFEESFGGYTEFFNLSNDEILYIRKILYENQ